VTNQEYQAAIESLMQGGLTEEQALANWALGIAGEAGEVVELAKKHLFHGKDLPGERVLEEVGGVLWYCTAFLSQCGFNLEEAMRYNIRQLEERHGGLTFQKSRGDFGKEK